MSPQHFKSIRESFGLTQEEFGNRLGVTQKTVSQYEIGFRVPGPTVRVIMRVLEKAPRSKATWLLELMNEISEAKVRKPPGRSR